MWDLIIHLLLRPASSLAHRSVSSTNTICNSPTSQLVDIVLLGLSLLGFPSRFKNASTRERFPHPYKECFVSLSNRCGISQSTPLRGPTSSLAHRSVSSSNTICNSLSPPLADIVLFGLSVSGFPSKFLKRVY